MAILQVLIFLYPAFAFAHPSLAVLHEIAFQKSMVRVGLRQVGLVHLYIWE